MKKSSKQILDQLEKEEKGKTIRGIFAILLLLLGGICFMAYLYDPFHATGKQYEVTITGACKPEADERAAKTRLIIKLDEGKNVRIIATRAGAYQVGKRVIVEELSSKRFSRKAYRFVKYVEPPIKYLNESEQKSYNQSLPDHSTLAALSNVSRSLASGHSFRWPVSSTVSSKFPLMKINLNNFYRLIGMAGGSNPPASLLS